MKERNGHPNAIFQGGKLSASQSVSLADPQSAKQTNVILMKERNGQPNAIFEGEKLSASLSASLADPQSDKQTSVILIKERNGQPNETNKWITQRNILRGKSEYHLSYRPGH